MKAGVSPDDWLTTADSWKVQLGHDSGQKNGRKYGDEGRKNGVRWVVIRYLVTI